MSSQHNALIYLFYRTNNSCLIDTQSGTQYTGSENYPESQATSNLGAFQHQKRLQTSSSNLDRLTGQSHPESSSQNRSTRRSAKESRFQNGLAGKSDQQKRLTGGTESTYPDSEGTRWHGR